jgi:C4-dicarboxylate-specific signal transduction histidine kinase
MIINPQPNEPSEASADRAPAQSEQAYEGELLDALLDSSPDDIYFKDVESRLLRISRLKALRVIEAIPRLKKQYVENPALDPRSLVKGSTDFDTYAAEDAQRAYDDEQAIIKTGQPLINKIERQTYKDGRTVWWTTSKMPLRDRTGKIIGTFGISKDITTLKEAELALEKATKDLVKASHTAGMAEVATGVLHNVGNAVNSVNISVEMAMGLLRQSRLEQLRKVTLLLKEHAGSLATFLTSDERGAKLVPFLDALSTALIEERATVLSELQQTRKGVDHIKDIVAMQQSYATTAGAIASVHLKEIVEDAIQMNLSAFERHGVTLRRHYLCDPEISTDRHKVLQILVNILRNAKYACDEGAPAEKTIDVTMTLVGTTAEIAIVDNGVGIAPDLLTKIFSHGFTTRRDGHGFGLHSGALAARELGGTLDAQSGGAGTGATFLLRLPLAATQS